MALIIPNSTDTTGGEEYYTLDQAEPDSLDFEILGHCRTNGVVSGGAVTSNGNTTVAVTAATVIVQGVSYAVSANAALNTGTSPTNNRFDLVIARVSGGSASLAVVQGVESATNPVYPQSMSVFGGAYDGSIHIDFDTDVVLAALYREGSTSITAQKIVDKRVFVSSTIQRQVAGTPAVSAPNSSLAFDTTHTPGVESGSGVWVRTNGQWVELAANNAFTTGPPIGSTVWFNGAVPTGYLLEDGSSYAVASYPALHAVIGDTFGGDGGTNFNVPNSINKFFRGGTVANLGNTGGAANSSLTTNELPSHRHNLNSHTHTLAHTHTINHGHTGSSVPVGNHQHDMDHSHSATSNETGSHSHYADNGFGLTRFVSTYPSGGNVVADYPGVGSSAGVDMPSIRASHPGTHHLAYHGAAQVGYRSELVTGNDGIHSHTITVNAINQNTGNGGGHSHSITVDDHSGSSGPANNTVTSGPNVANTEYTGSGNTFTNEPPYINKVPCIRYA